MRFTLLFFVATVSFLFGEEVIVSVAPYKFFVEKISGGEVMAHLFVPEGASPHSYEPTPKEMVNASKASLWFTIGEHFEEKAFSALRSTNPQLKKVDLRAGLSLIPTGGDVHHGCCSMHGYDLHIWLSPFLVKEQAKTIERALSLLLPDKKAIFEKNLTLFLGELSSLEEAGIELLSPLKGKTLFASHGAFAYLCRDYGLQMLSIEKEGKEATPKSFGALIQEVKRRGVRTIFSEVQYSQKPSEYAAELLGLKRVVVNPYAENYFVNMKSLYNEIQKGL